MSSVLLLFLFFCLTLNVAQIQEVDVIIMGAGMTGISAGHVLAEANMTNFIIIEAQNYVGGRTRTINFGSKGIGVAFGATWIAGACYNVSDTRSCYAGGYKPSGINPMLKLALKYNISFVNTPWPDPPMLNGTNNGKRIDQASIDIEYSKWYVVQQCLWDLALSIVVGATQDMSFYSGLIYCGWKQPLNAIQKTIQWSEFLQCGVNIKEYSLLGFEWGSGALGTYEVYGNQDLFITDTRGYQAITENYAKEYLDFDNINSEPKIILNSPIELIEYGNNTAAGVTVHISNSNKIYHAKYGLVTFSVGVLQSDIVTFSPTLPVWKRQAIAKTDIGKHCAVYIEWPYAFWNVTHPEIDNNQLILLADERYGFFTRIINYNHKDLLPGSLIWRMDMTGDVAYNIQFQDINKTIDELINNKFIDYFDNMPKPVHVLVANMTSNPYTQGVYSAYPVGYDWNKEVNRLQWNVDNVLYFGGEATANDTGFVSSAYFEGYRGAQMILNCLGYTNTDGYKCQGPFVEEEKSYNISFKKLHQPKYPRGRKYTKYAHINKKTK